MSEVLGMLETMEIMVSDARHVPFSNKVMVDQKGLLDLIDKLKYVVKNSEASARDAVDCGGKQPAYDDFNPAKDNAVQMIVDAKKESSEIRKTATDYADNVLARLQLLVTKLQKNLVRLEDNVKNGRLSIDENYTFNQEEGDHEIRQTESQREA